MSQQNFSQPQFSQQNFSQPQFSSQNFSQSQFSSQNLSQSVSSQTHDCQNAEEKAFIAPYLSNARRMLEEAKNTIDEIRRPKGRSKFNGAIKRSSQDYDGEGAKSQPFLTDDLSVPTSGKKRKREIECLSLSVSESDMDTYGSSDDECLFMIDEMENSEEIVLSSDESDFDSDSFSFDTGPGSNGSSEHSSGPPKKRQRVEAKIFSDYKENNKNGKKIIYIDSESDDEETDDGTEAHVVCFICGKYNTKKKFYLWISCTVCKNWFHKDCTHLWRKKIKDIEKDNFVCRYH